MSSLLFGLPSERLVRKTLPAVGSPKPKSDDGYDEPRIIDLVVWFPGSVKVILTPLSNLDTPLKPSRLRNIK